MDVVSSPFPWGQWTSRDRVLWRNKMETPLIHSIQDNSAGPRPPWGWAEASAAATSQPTFSCKSRLPSITGMIPESTLPNTTCCRHLPEKLHRRCYPKASARNQHRTAPSPQQSFPSKTQVKGAWVHLTFSKGLEPALNPRVPSASTSPESLGGGWVSLFLCFNN